VLLLSPAQVALYDQAADPDTHGWAQPDLSAPVWQGQCSYQPGPGPSDPRASEGGGAGPYEPNAAALATLYLPPDAPVADGMVAVVGSQHLALARARLVTDPTGTGQLDCWVAEGHGTDGWGQ